MNVNQVHSRQINPSHSKIDPNSVPFDPATVNAVWEKGQKVYGFYFFKRDSFGEVIAKHDFDKKTQYGWKIVRIVPSTQGGTDEIDNLEPMHWKNLQLKGEQ